MQGQLANQWGDKLKTAASLRTGVPQAFRDFSHSPQEEVETFLRRLHGSTVATAYELAERYDFSSVTTLVDAGGGGGIFRLLLEEIERNHETPVGHLPEAMRPF